MIMLLRLVMPDTRCRATDTHQSASRSWNGTRILSPSARIVNRSGMTPSARFTRKSRSASREQLCLISGMVSKADNDSGGFTRNPPSKSLLPLVRHSGCVREQSCVPISSNRGNISCILALPSNPRATHSPGTQAITSALEHALAVLLADG
jgi:hypothetical protein